MKNLFKKAYSLIDRNKCITTQCDYIADILYSEYSNIPKDILKYFFIRHSNQADEILKSINPLIAHTIHVKVLNFNNKQLMDDRIIQNANFTNYPPAYANDENREFYYDFYKNKYFIKGTWDYPIIAIKQKDKYIVIDGTCRFHHMQMCILYSFKFLKNKHKVYILEGEFENNEN